MEPIGVRDDGRDAANAQLSTRLEVTPEGEKAARQGINDIFKPCLAMKKFKGKNCPYSLDEPPSGADKSTIRWSVTSGDPGQRWIKGLLSDATDVSGRVVYTIRLQFTYTRGGQTYQYDRSAVLSQEFHVDLTQDPVKVT